MADIVFKLEGREVTFDAIPESPTKSILSDFKAAVEGQLDAIKCERHHRGPLITIYADDDHFEGFGFGLGTCCPEFGQKVRSLIMLPVRLPSDDSSTLHIATQTLILGEYE